MLKKRLLATAVMAAGLVASATGNQAFAQRAQFWDQAEKSQKINHVVVIFEENRSFDSYFGLYPGANGLANATNAPKQVDLNGNVFTTLPAVRNTNFSPSIVDTRFPANLPNAPFLINPFVPPSQMTGDLVHRYYQEQQQIDGGKMDKFAAVSDAAGLSMGFWDISTSYTWFLAQQSTLADNFFHAAFGGSFLNHFWLVCACSPTFPNAPASLKAVTDAKGNLITDGTVTPDGFAVNTIRSVFLHAPSDTNASVLLPPQTVPHIGDRLDSVGVSWKWYAGGMNDAVAGKPDPLFQFHHHPFNMMADLAPGSAGFKAHIKDRTDLINDITNNTLPAVTYYKPIGEVNDHPGYSDIGDSDVDLKDIVTRLQASPAWNDMAIFITFDEHGGQWDHVAPPTAASAQAQGQNPAVADVWGPGARVPLIVVSPFAKKGFVDHTQYDTTSILRFIEERFTVPALTTRDAAVNNLNNAFVQ
jgi:phospholipase C